MHFPFGLFRLSSWIAPQAKGPYRYFFSSVPCLPCPSIMGAQSLLGCLLLFTLMSLSTAGLVRKVLRHRRQTLSPHTEHNATLPSVGHPMVFSHVYNINVPASSLCSVDLEASEGTQVHPKDVTPVPPGHHVTEHTLNGENQIVFTHRINIPRQACGCTDDFPGLKDLVSRLEMLEGEVSALRDQCSSEQLTGRSVTQQRNRLLYLLKLHTENSFSNISRNPLGLPQYEIHLFDSSVWSGLGFIVGV